MRGANKVDCLVINLTTARDRMSFMSKQLEALGMSFSRLRATTPSTLGEEGLTFNWDSWERPLRDTEKACFLSHFRAWQYAASNNGYTLILEDDALLSCYTPRVLAIIEAQNDIEHVTLEVRNRKKIVGKRTHVAGAGHRVIRLYQDRSGAAAYVLSALGAQKLLERAKIQTALADAMLCKSYDLKSFQIEPACAVQLDCASYYGITPTLETASQIDGDKRCARSKSSPAFFARRIGAQFRMAFRAISCLSVAERRKVELRREDFATVLVNYPTNEFSYGDAGCASD